MHLPKSLGSDRTAASFIPLSLPSEKGKGDERTIIDRTHLRGDISNQLWFLRPESLRAIRGTKVHILQPKLFDMEHSSEVLFRIHIAMGPEQDSEDED